MNNPAHPATLTEGMMHVTLKAIIPSLTNPRRTFTDMAELTDSVRQHGVIQPVLIRPLTAEQAEERNTIAVYELVCGERRFRAAHEAQLDEIPAVIRELTDAQAMELQIIENLQRKDVSEIEEAEGYQLMMDDHGYTADELADRIGKSRGYIYGRLKLLALCSTARKAMLDGTLSPSVALLIARIPVPSLQEQAMKDVMFDPQTCDPMSARKAKQHITDRYTLAMSRARHDLADATLIPAAGACEGCDKRTSCNRDVFPDISADVCTDPDCFAAKDAMHAAGIRAQYQQRGHTLLAGEDAYKHLLFGSAKDLSSFSDLIDLDNISEINEDKTWREILEGAEAQLTVLENSRNEFIECISRTALKAALIKVGLAAAESSNTEEEAGEEEDELEHNRNQLNDPKNDPHNEYRKMQEQRAAFEQERKNLFLTQVALRPLIIGQLSDRLAAGQHAFDEDARLIARLLLAERFEWDAEQCTAVIRRHMPQQFMDDALDDVEPADDDAVLQAALNCIDSMIQSDMFTLLLDLALWLHCAEYSTSMQTNSAAVEACAARYGINVAQVRAEATGEPLPAENASANSLDAEPAPTPDTAAQAQETGAGEPEEPVQEEDAQETENPAPQRSQKASPVKYQNPSDPTQTWSGRGKKPVWVAACLAEGKTLADIEIKAASAATAQEGKAKSSGRKAAGGNKKTAKGGK